MKQRPKVGDRVEFRSHGTSRIGKIIAVAVTGMHFVIETPIGHKHRNRKIGLDSIIRILPTVDPNSPKDDGEKVELLDL